MERIETYRADNGQLEQDPKRAKAHDLSHAMGQAKSKSSTNGAITLKSKVDWHVSMELLDNAALVITHLQEYLTEQEKIDAKEEEVI